MSSKIKSLKNQKNLLCAQTSAFVGYLVVLRMARQLLDLVISITIASNRALAFYHKQTA